MHSYNKIIKSLIKKDISISIAESFTGGQLSKAFTDISGVSQIFQMGLVTYSNKSKNSILKIPIYKITKYGAVSKEVASAMAFNLLKQNNIDISIAVSGIAGPGGGTEDKPVGLVHHVMAIKNKLIHKELIYNGDRENIRKQTVQTCLKLILSEIF